jgi:biotin operon repressor
MLNKIINLLNGLSHLSYLLNKGKSGNAEELAEKTKMSRSALFEQLKELREHDIPIEFDKTEGCYKTKGRLKFHFIVTIEDEKIIEIKGGKKNQNKFY